jgi:hypothetical protein
MSLNSLNMQVLLVQNVHYTIMLVTVIDNAFLSLFV